MVMGASTRNVGVFAGREVEPLHRAELDHQVERSEQGRPADPEAPAAGRRRQVRRGEMAVVVDDQLGDRAAWLGQPVAGGIKRSDDRIRGVEHPAILVVVVRSVETESQLVRAASAGERHLAQARRGIRIEASPSRDRFREELAGRIVASGARPSGRSRGRGRRIRRSPPSLPCPVAPAAPPITHGRPPAARAAAIPSSTAAPSGRPVGWPGPGRRVRSGRRARD